VINPTKINIGSFIYL